MVLRSIRKIPNVRVSKVTSPRKTAHPTSSRAHLCQRCAAILSQQAATDRLMCDFSKTFSVVENAEELEQSTCKLCSFLGVIKPDSPSSSLWCTVTNDDTMFSRRIGIEDVENPHGSNNQCVTLNVMNSSSGKHNPEIGLYPKRANLESATNWIRNCQYHHGELCQSGYANTLSSGTKMIDCNKRTVVYAPTRHFEYAALSYVWGRDSANGADEQSYSTCELPSPLPRTIEDAITVTKSLGIEYLWVDRYCIDQNNVLEKHAQIQNMGSIYSLATVTLIAAAGNDPNYGLPGVHQPRWGRRAPFETIGDATLVLTPVPASTEIELSSWASRAWTYQECFLSQRRLFFTERQMVYICNTTAYSEATDDLISHAKLGAILPNRKRNVIYHPSNHYGLAAAAGYMQEYSKRHLSYESDALHAVTGILQTLRAWTDPCHHISGVPFVSEPGFSIVKVALNWYHVRTSRRRPGFPSWSSLGWVGLIHHTLHPRIPEYLRISVKDRWKYTPLSESLAVNPTLLKVTGLMFPVSIAAAKDLKESPMPYGAPCVILPLTDELDIYNPVHWDRDLQQVRASGPLLAMVTARDLAIAVGWILSREGEHYERVGLFEFELTPRAHRRREVLHKDGSSSKVAGFESRSSWRNPRWLRHSTKKTILLG